MLPQGFFSKDLELPLDGEDPIYIVENSDKWPILADERERGFTLLCLYLIRERGLDRLMIVGDMKVPDILKDKVGVFSQEEFGIYTKPYDAIISRVELKTVPLNMIVFVPLDTNKRTTGIKDTIYCVPYSFDYYIQESSKESLQTNLKKRLEHHMYRRTYFNYDIEAERFILEDDKLPLLIPPYNQLQKVEELARACLEKNIKTIVSILSSNEFYTRENVYCHEMNTFYLNLLLNDSAYISRCAVASGSTDVVKIILSDNRITRNAMDCIALQDAISSNKNAIIDLYDKCPYVKVPGSKTKKKFNLYSLSLVLKIDVMELSIELLEDTSIQVLSDETFVEFYRMTDKKLEKKLGDDVIYVPNTHLHKSLLCAFRQDRDKRFIAQELLNSVNFNYRVQANKW